MWALECVYWFTRILFTCILGGQRRKPDWRVRVTPSRMSAWWHQILRVSSGCSQPDCPPGLSPDTAVIWKRRKQPPLESSWETPEAAAPGQPHPLSGNGHHTVGHSSKPGARSLWVSDPYIRWQQDFLHTSSTGDDPKMMMIQRWKEMLSSTVPGEVTRMVLGVCSSFAQR